MELSDSETRVFGGPLLGAYDERGLAFVGKIGSGHTEKDLEEISG